LRQISTRKVAIAIGIGRIGLGAAFLIKPEASTTLLGLDSITARRISWLAQMAAARDLALGVGTVTSSLRGADPAIWLLGGAASDAVDAIVIGDAVRTRRLSVAKAGAMVLLAAGAGALGAAVAYDMHRSSASG
jgi:peptide-methionine (R)-S-oxide reductase